MNRILSITAVALVLGLSTLSGAQAGIRHVGGGFGHGGFNSSSISQRGFGNAAETNQIAGFGGSNASRVNQNGAGNVAVTNQAAF